MGPRMRRRVYVALALLACLGVLAFAVIEKRTVMCTAMGGDNVIILDIPKALFVPTGDVVFKVCDDDGCASAKSVLTADAVATQPDVRDTGTTFRALGRDFEPGQVTVHADLHGADGTLVASRKQRVELTRYYPNGKECDGDGYVVGRFRMESSDRV